jgi:putative membrane protein
MKIAVAAVTFGLLALAPDTGWAQTPDLQTASPQISSPMAINIMSTAAFVDNATWNDMFVILSSRLALEKSEDPKIRTFAQTMIRDHARERARIATAIASENLAASPPKALDHEDNLLLEKLLLVTPGADFDRLYIDMQIDRHERTLQFLRTYSATGESPALKQLAAATVNRTRDQLSRASQLAPISTTDRLASGER